MIYIYIYMYIYIYIYICMYLYKNFICHVQMSKYIYQEQDIYFCTSYILVSFKPSNTHPNANVKS